MQGRITKSFVMARHIQLLEDQRKLSYSRFQKWNNGEDHNYEKEISSSYDVCALMVAMLGVGCGSKSSDDSYPNRDQENSAKIDIKDSMKV